MINSLKDNQVFVFGSNKLGQHLGGAAKQAYEQFGAEWGVAEGMTGNSYAFPTLTSKFDKVSLRELYDSRNRLYEVAENNRDKEFLLTAVGTGIAGFSIGVIKQLFNNPPRNIIKLF